MLQLRLNLSSIMQNDPSKFFRAQTVLLTGGTGCLSGCLLFKLALKVEAKQIYVLVRGSEARAIDNNTLATLRSSELAELRFTNLTAFLHVSTAYVNSFLPDGVVEERIYELGDAERHLSEILATGSLSQQSFPELLRFPSPYSLAKHLTERLLLSRHPRLPLLVVRPTLIGPAISEPHPYYTRPGSCPLSTYIRGSMKDPDSGVIRVAPGHISGSNIVDEIPVDLVANLLLLHAVQGTLGIVHAGAQSYIPRTLAQLHETITSHLDILDPRPKSSAFRYVSDVATEEGHHNVFWRFLGRDWHFSDAASRDLKEIRGVLSMRLEGHDPAEFMATRARDIAQELAACSTGKLCRTGVRGR
ncbi:hypothetical protein C8R46DRAFT_1344519 [Mycena filopes]|nr:hypothetical protein C8R46DRAFT_1344519 [Mycena filopes]